MKKSIIVCLLMAFLMAGCSVKMDSESHEPQTHSHPEYVRNLEQLVGVMSDMADIAARHQREIKGLTECVAGQTELIKKLISYHPEGLVKQ